MRTFLKLSAPVIVMGAIFVSTGLAAESPPTPIRAPAPAVPAADHTQLQVDSDMTQRMSTPNASGAMQDGKVTDPQLTHSSNPAFVAQLEQHQQDIDRMLARTP